jgi:hypothetical protein
VLTSGEPSIADRVEPDDEGCVGSPLSAAGALTAVMTTTAASTAASGHSLQPRRRRFGDETADLAMTTQSMP